MNSDTTTVVRYYLADCEQPALKGDFVKASKTAPFVPKGQDVRYCFDWDVELWFYETDSQTPTTPLPVSRLKIDHVTIRQPASPETAAEAGRYTSKDGRFQVKVETYVHLTHGVRAQRFLAIGPTADSTEEYLAKVQRGEEPPRLRAQSCPQGENVTSWAMGQLGVLLAEALVLFGQKNYREARSRLNKMAALVDLHQGFDSE